MTILLLTPPFTQINTPYPATAFLKRFLVSNGLVVKQADLGLELTLSIFSRDGLQQVFTEVKKNNSKPKRRSRTVLNQSEKYYFTIDPVVKFLQTRETSLAYLVCQDGFLPQTERLANISDLEWTFGNQGIIDQASYLATHYLDGLFDFIRSELVPDFGFSRYAEQIALSATDFTPIHEKLQAPETLFDSLLRTRLLEHLHNSKPKLVALTVPFPGCLYGALRCGKVIKEYDQQINVALGGGYINTELRQLNESRVFDYTDFVVLDQGELPILKLTGFITGQKGKNTLCRTFLRENNTVRYCNATSQNASFSETGYPDYSDLDLSKYLSVVEIPNPMHRLWNDGKWNKMMIARGCYWKKCAFCDVTLDYIASYESLPAKEIVDRIEQVMVQTGQSGFHFVDEAAPPALLKNIALEILQRRLTISWWTNIRFEKNFNEDLCRLMAKSGCIAVSGGLETATDRLLKLMNKGVTIPQAAIVLKNFSQAGILVHGYLMYGFPTQTEQETIDSLEIVRQFFDHRLLDSCYWHRFSLTAHSPIAKEPGKFGVTITGPSKGNFAWNDLQHMDSSGCSHENYSLGLEKAAYNYMQEIGIEFNLNEWFDFEIPQPTVSPQFIELLLKAPKQSPSGIKNKRLIWLGNKPELLEKSGKNNKITTKIKLIASNHQGSCSKKIDTHLGKWLIHLLDTISVFSETRLTVQQVSDEYEKVLHKSFQTFLESELWQQLIRYGLIAV